MKANIKKLGVVMIIAAIAMFMAVPMVSAGGKFIQGNYAIIGSGACLFAVSFPAPTDDPTLTPTNPFGMGPNTWEGVYTFNKDGTGEIDAIHRAVDITLTVALAQVTWKFTYTVDGGKITFTYIPGTYVANFKYGPNAGLTLDNVAIPESWDGFISPDGKTLFVSFGVPLKLIITNLGFEIMCNGALQGFRTND